MYMSNNALFATENRGKGLEVRTPVLVLGATKERISKVGSSPKQRTKLKANNFQGGKCIRVA